MNLTDLFKKCCFVMVVFSMSFLAACSEDDEPLIDPTAAFTTVNSEADYREVAFTNVSQNATSYSWSFGDGNTSTEESPVHVYDGPGTFQVTLTASNSANVTDTRTEEVVLVNPNAALEILTGTASGKTWQLLADVSTGQFPILVGPNSRDQIWWALGQSDQLCVRECIMDDTWTFNTDGTYTFDNNGDFWGEGGVWQEDLVGCFDATNAANFVGPNGEDLSAWNSGTNPFTFDIASNKITVNGGFIGLTKVGSTAEYTTPQASVEYTVAKLVEGTVDTLVLETTLTDAGGYWSFTLVSYDNAADAVVVDACAVPTTANVTFKMNFNDYTGTAVTPEVNGTFNGWCGACNAMTDEDGDGIWEVTLELPVGDHEFKFSADAWADQEALTDGSSCTLTSNGNINRTLTVAGDMTYGPVCWNSCENCPTNIAVEDIQGKTWMLPNEAGTIRVGDGIGGGNYFASPADWLPGKECLFDDGFTFGADGSLAVDMGDSVFVEARMIGVDADGCMAVADLPSNLANWGGGAFTYTFTDATDDARAKITVTGNGAYLGFYKGANGSEPVEPVDGSITYEVLSYAPGRMEVAVDITAEQNGAVYWTYVLVSQ